MAIYQYGTDRIEKLTESTFQQLGIQERQDLQRLLRDQIEILSPDLLVISEEFGSFDGSSRRIDLLAIDRLGSVVVIELKRTEDGGHMELQAVRYAAMVSNLRFEEAVEIFGEYLSKRKIDCDPHETITEWLNVGIDDFNLSTKIVLVSAEFSKELTSAVLWLNEQSVQISCVRIKPYTRESAVFLDIQQIVPLPEAEDYQVQVRLKQQSELKARQSKGYGPWNGQDFYIAQGEYPDANWDDCRKYGFVVAGGGAKFTRPFDRVHVGARVLVHIPKLGYVGVGKVTESNTTVDQFVVQTADGPMPIHQAPLKADDMSQHIGNRDLCCNLIRVEWIKTVDRKDAFWQKNLFANQNTACKLRDADTIQAVCKHFGIDAQHQE
ncbi:hypothetical protein [Rhodopirellula baltica]